MSSSVLVTHTITPNIDLGATSAFERAENIVNYFNDEGNGRTNIISSKYHVFSAKTNGPILQDTKFHPHPLVMCCSEAYSKHYPLILSPDDIWLLIAQGVAKHIDINGQELRTQFISNKDEANLKNEGKDKIEICVEMDSYMNSGSTQLSDVNWSGVVDEIASKVDHHLNDNAVQLLTCNFSTSGPIEKTASQIVIMEAFKNYFAYFNVFSCGLPSVSLLGTLQDWKDIKTRVSQLDKYGLAFWTKALHPILDLIIETAEKPSTDPLPAHLIHFWNSIALYGFMSGSYHITGWIAYFFPYKDDNSVTGYLKNLKEDFLKTVKVGGFGVSATNFPSGLSSALVQFINSPLPGVNSVNYLAGFFGYDYDEQLQGMKTRIGWAVAISKDQNTSEE